MAAISLTSLGLAYAQDFDALSNTAGSTTNNLAINGWLMTEGGGGARDNEQYAVDTGGSTTGDTYSYGAAGSTERALGELRSGTLVSIFGAAFVNDTGTNVTALDVAYTGEEWRLGTAGRTDQLSFEYSTNATDLTTGTWTAVAALTFVTPDTTTVGAKNGNAGAEHTSLSSTISGLNIPSGATFWIRWTDTDASGADDGLAIDDFALTPRGVPHPRSDFNDDLTSDILWRNDDGRVSIWDSGQIGSAHVVGADIPSSWQIAGKGDFDGNGHDDILWRNDNGAVSIWDNGQIGGAHIVAGAGAVPTSWHISGTGDFAGDGHADILWRHDNGAVSIWDNGQIGGAHIIAAAGVIPSGWNIADTGDFDGNGHDDILWRNDNGAVSIWDNGQIGGAHIIAQAGVVPNSWHISGTGDFDGNHDDDILWRNDNGAASIWDNGQIGGAHIIANAGDIPAGWHIV